MHAQIAMRVLMPALAMPVGRIYGGTGDQCTGRDEGDQAIGAKTVVQVRLTC
jgi:hypothetical protein